MVTARPSYSRIKTALDAIKAHPELELQLVVAGSALLDRYGSAVNYIQADGFEITERVYMVLEGDGLITMAKTTGLGLMELATVFDNISPDVVITIADRYETIATSIAASYMNIPVAHVQGGEVTGSIDEKVRHANTKLANLHFVSSKKAQERVLRLGEDPNSVYLTGCPSIDLAAKILENPEISFDPYEKYGGVGAFPNLSDGYIIVMQHPVTTERLVAKTHIFETLYAVRDSGISALWFWPNADAGSDGTSTGIRVFREHEDASNIHFFKNMDPIDFLCVLNNSKGIVGNSSAGIRECAFLGVPAVNIGSRQMGRERGKNVLDVDHDRATILNAIKTHFSDSKIPSETIYGDGKAGARIADILARVDFVIEKRLTY